MPKYYKINVEKCDPKEVGPIHSVGEFVIMDGQYCCQYDVVEELLPPDICNQIRFETDEAKEFNSYWSDKGEMDEVDFLPLGIENIPLGAVITEIEAD